TTVSGRKRRDTIPRIAAIIPPTKGVRHMFDFWFRSRTVETVSPRQATVPLLQETVASTSHRKPRRSDLAPSARRDTARRSLDVLQAAHEAAKADRPKVSRAHPVIKALLTAGRPLTQRELAAAIGCSPGHATRLRKQVEHALYLDRIGRCLYCEIRVEAIITD